MQAKDLFDQAVLLDPGEYIEVPAVNPEELNSLRSSLAYQRTKWREAVNPDGDILISRKGQSRLILQKIDSRPPAVKHKLDGSVEVLESPDDVAERERMERMEELQKEEMK